MRYLKTLNESFKLVDLDNSKWYGKQPDASYINNVKSACVRIAMEEHSISEKSFKLIDQLNDICTKTLTERAQEFDAIVHNSKQRNMRVNYAAESVYHTILQGRLD